jgi:nucleotide-binding universal stress UspA family protein
MTIKRIFHASDFSRASRPAFRLAQQLAKAFRAELIVFHAYQVVAPLAGEGPLPPRLFQEMAVSAREGARRRLDRLVRPARRGRMEVSTLLVEGPAAPSIVRAAKRKRAGLIVLGTHGRTGVRRMLLGSVAERVVRTAACPVLTVGSRR